MILYKLGQNGMLLWEGKVEDTTLTITYGLLLGAPQVITTDYPSNEEAEKELKRRYNKKRDREGYSEEQPTTKPPMPMLATSYPDFKHKLPPIVYVQSKLDGVRCIGSNKGLVTRRNEPISSMPHVLEALSSLPPGIVLDGELYCHGVPFQELLSMIKRDVPTNEAINSISYFVFDIVNDNPFSTRVNEYQYFCDALGWPLVPLITQLAKKKDLEKYLKARVEQGFEGIIVRDPEGYYEPNRRSYSIQKYKKFDDEEYRIIDITCSSRGREEGAAIYVCKTKSGKTFQVRPRMSIPQRSMIYRERESFIGYWTRVTYQGLSSTGVPRQPIAEGLEPTKEQLK